MALDTLQSRLDNKKIALLLAGPLLRRVTSESVTVWVALQQPATVNLEVLNSDGSSLTPPMKARRATV